jgi:mono/diheme cytochrome c family protein
MVLKIATFVFASSLLLACNNSGNKFSTSEKTNSQQEIDADQAKGLYSIHCASCHGESWEWQKQPIYQPVLFL